jgi:hypothetical protein
VPSHPQLAAVEPVLVSSDQRARTFAGRLARLEAQASAGGHPDRRGARAPREEVRRTRASLAVVQSYLREQTRALGPPQRGQRA